MTHIINAAELDRLGRWRATSTTWFQKIAYRLRWDFDNDDREPARWLLGYETGRLLTTALADAALLVELLNDDDVDEADALVRDLANRLKARRLAAKLENVSGRTPEEAASFMAKAAALRGAV